MAKIKVILFGGTFDPIHLGHTNVASFALEYIGAEKIVFIPAKCSPLKNCFPKASDDDRLKMIALAVAENKNFQLSDYELKKAESSYTLHTVRQFQAEYGSEVLIHWLTGADSIDELSRWYKITALLDECNLSVMYRAGCNIPNFGRFNAVWGPGRIEKLQQNVIPTPLIDISSTQIRNELAGGRNVGNMLWPAVADYIHEHGLYKPNIEP